MDRQRAGTNGPEFDQLRQRMVERQLHARGIRDARVLRAFQQTPREEFVPDELRCHAYDDSPLAIGHGQTISQPFTVALMAEAAAVGPEDRVLEIGTGSGYGAAILSWLGHDVHTVERIGSLAVDAQQRLARLGFDHVVVHEGDGTRGWPAAAPYDVIVTTAGGRALPPPYVEQLAEGGRIVIPLGRSPTAQRMKRFTKAHGELLEEDLGHFAFVPLVGQFGWAERGEEGA